MIHHTLINRFIPLLKKVITEFWDDGNNVTDMGSIINEFHKNRLCDLIADVKSKVVIGNPNASEDKHLPPTVVLNPEKDISLMQEEIFGPILPLITY